LSDVPIKFNEKLEKWFPIKTDTKPVEQPVVTSNNEQTTLETTDTTSQPELTEASPADTQENLQTERQRRRAAQKIQQVQKSN
jgi:hypothetical protein